jgi:type I restriction enzyme, S subunit
LSFSIEDDLFDLPDGWHWTTTSEVCSSVRDGTHDTPKYIDNGIPLITSKNLKCGKIDFSTAKFISIEEHSQIKIRSGVDKGDIIFAMIGTIGNPVVVKSDREFSIKNVGLFKKNENLITPNFLQYWLSSYCLERILEERKLIKGTTQKFIPLGNLRILPVPIAPLNEQKRIADKLDRLLAKVDNCRERLDRILPILKRFRQSILAAATTGILTEDWRRDKNRSLKSWKTKSGNEVFSFITSGSRGWAAYYSNDGAIFLRVGNLNHDTIELDLEKIQYVNPPLGSEGKRTRIEIGDILISITADIGMVAFIHEDIGEAYINQHLCLVRQTGEYHGAYLAHYLASPVGGLYQLSEMQRGVTKAGLTLGDIRSVQLMIPELDEQIEIVHRIEKLFEFADRLEARYQTARAQIDKLTPALLDKAFKGELVPQDPTDEPAAALLAKIQQARTNPENQTPKQPKTPRKPATPKVKMLIRSNIKPSHLADILKNSGSLTAEALWNASKLSIDDFYDQLKAEELQNLLREVSGEPSSTVRLLEAI